MMADEPKTVAEKIRALLTSTKSSTTPATTPTITSTPAPGFRFATGDRVLDLLTGSRGTVVAWYQSATNTGPVYEVRIVYGPIVVRFENQLERDGGQNVPPPLPRI